MYTYETYSWKSIQCIEDPVHSSYIDRENYFKIYDPLLKTFDGADADSFIDDWFERSPVNSSILMFKDNDSRSDFYYMAVEMKLLLPMKEICAGESASEKKKRMKPQKKKIKRQIPDDEKKRYRSQQMMKTVSKLQDKLKDEENPDIRERLNKKLDRIMEMLGNHSI